MFQPLRLPFSYSSASWAQCAICKRKSNLSLYALAQRLPVAPERITFFKLSVNGAVNSAVRIYSALEVVGIDACLFCSFCGCFGVLLIELREDRISHFGEFFHNRFDVVFTLCLCKFFRCGLCRFGDLVLSASSSFSPFSLTNLSTAKISCSALFFASTTALRFLSSSAYFSASLTAASISASVRFEEAVIVMD